MAQPGKRAQQRDVAQPGSRTQQGNFAQPPNLERVRVRRPATYPHRSLPLVDDVGAQPLRMRKPTNLLLLKKRAVALSLALLRESESESAQGAGVTQRLEQGEMRLVNVRMRPRRRGSQRGRA
eukprot:6180501-Pleurochrysis_carterae.AAC.1